MTHADDVLGSSWIYHVERNLVDKMIGCLIFHLYWFPVLWHAHVLDIMCVLMHVWLYEYSMCVFVLLIQSRFSSSTTICCFLMRLELLCGACLMSAPRFQWFHPSSASLDPGKLVWSAKMYGCVRSNVTLPDIRCMVVLYNLLSTKQDYQRCLTYVLCFEQRQIMYPSVALLNTSW
jgi:hypothetical protein